MAIRGQGGSAAAYATTKSALMGLTVDLADAYGPDGVRVNTVVPGMVGTPAPRQPPRRARASTPRR